MQKKIYKTIIILISVSLSIFTLFGLLISYAIYQNGVETELRSVMCTMTQNNLSPQKMAEQINQITEYDVRVTFVSADGEVLFDTDNASDNHSDRKEIIKAKENGHGEATRFSATTGKTMYYCAMKYNDGIIRFSRPYKGILSVLFMMIPIAMAIAGIILIISTVIAMTLSKKLAKPISDFSDAVWNTKDPKGRDISTECEELKSAAQAVRMLVTRYNKVRYSLKFNIDDNTEIIVDLPNQNDEKNNC